MRLQGSEGATAGSTGKASADDPGSSAGPARDKLPSFGHPDNRCRFIREPRPGPAEGPAGELAVWARPAIPEASPNPDLLHALRRAGNNAMPVTHEPWLVALSLVVAIQGAYVGLSLAVQIGEAAGLRRRLLLAGAAVSLAVAIWAMHFVGMLAARMPFQVDYLVFPTLLSFLVCVIVVGAAVYATSSGPLTLLRLTLSACLMGGGIFTMHYIGMSALSASAYMVHDRYYVAASMAIAIAASGLALWLATGRGGRPPLILSAVAFGIAVSGMHYTAMEGLTLLPYPGATAGAPALSADLLAIVVAIVAFCISGIFLLTLVPDR